VLASIQGRIAAASQVKVGTVSTGCDGLPTINPLNGTTCQGTQPGTACSLVLYHPLTRSVLSSDVGRSLSSSAGACAPGSVASPAGISSAYAHPADCTTAAAALRKKRRFVDNLGHIYGPDGELLDGMADAAVLETDYVHVYGVGVCIGPGR
jgi:hypothetical protein